MATFTVTIDDGLLAQVNSAIARINGRLPASEQLANVQPLGVPEIEAQVNALIQSFLLHDLGQQTELDKAKGSNAIATTMQGLISVKES